ncbi:MAG: hypothetical protein ABSD11_14200 [Methylocella sp.]
MAMQIDPAFAHIPPGPEGIVAQDEFYTIDTHLSIGMYTFPAIAANDRGIIIVAYDKVFVAMQRPDERGYTLRPLANGEVAQVPDLISRYNHRIPPVNHLAIHLGNRRKRTPVKAQCSSMAEVMVTCEVDRHCLRP